MMHYREMLETTCCRGCICRFCHADFIRSQTKKKPGAAGIGEAALAEKSIPKGLACPHCATESSGAPMKQLRRGDVARSYSGSPLTQAAMAQRDSIAVPPAESPLRVGDDFSAMTRKLRWMESGAKGSDGKPGLEAHDGMEQSLGQSMSQSLSGGKLTIEPVAEAVDVGGGPTAMTSCVSETEDGPSAAESGGVAESSMEALAGS
jgi:hypothetical protein